MCFRPATASVSVVCPECSKRINEVLGTIPSICPFCSTDLSEVIAATKDDLSEILPASPPVKAPPSPQKHPKL